MNDNKDVGVLVPTIFPTYFDNIKLAMLIELYGVEYVLKCFNLVRSRIILNTFDNFWGLSYYMFINPISGKLIERKTEYNELT
jgi:hypothetical protein